MIRDIFGGVVPSLQDALVSLLMPHGSFILLNFILITVELSIFLISWHLYNQYIKKGDISPKQRVLPFLLIYLTGLFNTLLLGVILMILALLSISYLFKVKKSLGNEGSGDKKTIDSSKALKVEILFLLLFDIFLLVLFTIGGLLLAFLLGWWIYGWTMQIGVISGLVMMIARKVFNLEILKENWTLSSKTKMGIKITLLIMPLLFGTIFVISLMPTAHPSAPEEPKSSELTNLRIMTYNIRLGTGIEEDPENQWFNRKEEFVKYLDGIDLDVFGIQEAQYFQIQDIESNLESHEYVWTGKGRDNGVYGGEACTIFFDREKYKYVDGDTFWLSDITHYPSNTWGGNCNRIVTWVRLEVKTGESKGAQFFAFNTHYDFADEWQIKASKLITKKITQLTGGLPTILMGDFNMHNNSDAFDILENYQDPGDKKPMRDAYRVYKEDTIGYLPYNTTSPQDWDVRKDPVDKSRIDFIFVSEHIAINRCTILKDSYDGYRTYSDHYPVYMNCTF
ncbi:MAG: endonuclease/exonuclease/phosphatase family protein [Promethearchaeia archaeon]